MLTSKSLAVLFAVLSHAGLFAQTAAPAQPAAEMPAQFPGCIRLLLPPRIYAVPGIEMNVYFDNVSLMLNPAQYAFDVTCAKGKQQVERWTLVPTEQDAGQYSFTLEVRDEANKIVARAESVLHIVPKNAGSGMPLSLLTIGDSLTQRALYQARLLELCKTDGNPQITLVGHMPNPSNPNIRIEGYGGWTAGTFATRFKEEKRENGTVDWRMWNASGSPFLYSDGQGKFQLDFARYCQEFNAGKGPDFVTILLGANDMLGSKDETVETSIDTMFKHYDMLVDMIRRVRHDTKIGVLLVLPPAATQDAFGANYQCGQTRWKYKRNQQRLVERMMQNYGNREAEDIYLVPTNVNLDCANNYPTVKAPLNDATKIEGVRLNNGVHPETEGYRQVGDTIFCWMKAQLAEAPVAGK